MTRTHHIAVTTCAIAAGVLLAAGCTPEEPVAEPTTSALPSTPPSPSPPPEVVLVAPERPVAMDDDGPAGAEAAAKYFLALDSYVQATGNTQEWDAMSHADCGYCTARSEQARQIEEAHLTWTGGEIRADVRHVYAQDPATGIWSIDLTIVQEAADVFDSAGNVVKSVPAGQAEKRIELATREGEWIVVGLGELQE